MLMLDLILPKIKAFGYLEMMKRRLMTPIGQFQRNRTTQTYSL